MEAPTDKRPAVSMDFVRTVMEKASVEMQKLIATKDTEIDRLRSEMVRLLLSVIIKKMR